MLLRSRNPRQPPSRGYKPGTGRRPSCVESLPCLSKWLQIRGRLQTGAGARKEGQEKYRPPLIVLSLSHPIW